jgi:hypothetical protein
MHGFHASGSGMPFSSSKMIARFHNTHDRNAHKPIGWMWPYTINGMEMEELLEAE